jgi:hypothetical protein
MDCPRTYSSHFAVRILSDIAFACIYVCIYVCMYICVCVYTHTHTHTCTFSRYGENQTYVGVNVKFLFIFSNFTQDLNCTNKYCTIFRLFHFNAIILKI